MTLLINWFQSLKLYFCRNYLKNHYPFVYFQPFLFSSTKAKFLKLLFWLVIRNLFGDKINSLLNFLRSRFYNAVWDFTSAKYSSFSFIMNSLVCLIWTFRIITLFIFYCFYNKSQYVSLMSKFSAHLCYFILQLFNRRDLLLKLLLDFKQISQLKLLHFIKFLSFLR